MAQKSILRWLARSQTHVRHLTVVRTGSGAIPRGYGEVRRESPRPESSGYWDWVALTTADQRRLKPWTLVPLPGEPELVAVRQTLWWRLVTWWLNRGRMRQRRVAVEALQARIRQLEADKRAGKPLADGTFPSSGAGL